MIWNGGAVRVKPLGYVHGNVVFKVVARGRSNCCRRRCSRWSAARSQCDSHFQRGGRAGCAHLIGIRCRADFWRGRAVHFRNHWFWRTVLAGGCNSGRSLRTACHGATDASLRSDSSVPHAVAPLRTEGAGRVARHCLCRDSLAFGRGAWLGGDGTTSILGMLGSNGDQGPCMVRKLGELKRFVSPEEWLQVSSGTGDAVYTDANPGYPPLVPLIQVWSLGPPPILGTTPRSARRGPFF